MRRRTATVLLITILIAVFWQLKPTTPAVFIGGKRFTIERATTASERERGLSGRDYLSANAGMLFEFPNEDTLGFWMKDMHFSIDIVWLNAQKRVVHIERNVSPNTYPQVFTPTEKARYVLELPPHASDSLAEQAQLSF
jgi:uncharacterized membrane protein (UPF0127 family)